MTAPALARLAALLADDTRATFCLALLDGRAWTAGELAGHAGVAPATATGHLHKLVAAGLLTEQRQGRHRYVRLADARVAQLIEELAAHLPPAPTPARTLRAATASTALARGRTCYDHLAGRLGVALTDAFDRTGLLSRADGFTLTPAGLAWLADLPTLSGQSEGTWAVADPAQASRKAAQSGGAGQAGRAAQAGKRAAPSDAAGLPRGSRRPLARGCLDWTERREHLAGTAGAAVCAHLFGQGWIARIGSGRAVRVTPAGVTALTGLFGGDPAWAGVA
jgi:DNA-binding transcriptional ArsR family regulator